MATNTSILGLSKPAYTDDADVAVINSNSDLIDAEAGRTRANFAAEYSASSAYAVGELCTKDGNLYECNTPIGSGGEAWTAGHWTQKSVGEVTDALSQAIASIDGVTSLGTKSSLSDLQSALVTAANNAKGKAERYVSFTTSFTSNGFVSGLSYKGEISVISYGSNYIFFTVFCEGVGNSSAVPVNGIYNNGTWIWQELATNGFTTVTFTPSTGVTDNLFVRRSGRIICVNGYLTSNTAFGSNMLLGTIESGNRPTSAVRLLAGVANVAYEVGDIAYISIGDNGEIRITAKGSNTYKVCYFSASYVVQS